MTGRSVPVLVLMAFQSLRPTPVHAPRPQVLDITVIARSIDGRRTEFEGWLAAAGLHASPEMVDFAIDTALRAGRFEAYRAARKLEDNLGWPADAPLVRLLDQVLTQLPALHREVTREWVLEQGYRVPAAEGDAIEWLSPEGEPRSGRVAAVAKLQGMAYCVIGDTDPADEQFHVRVPGEAIYANITQARYEIEEPVLGARYEDAPALAAAYEADGAAQAKAKAGAATTPAPQGPDRAKSRESCRSRFDTPIDKRCGDPAADQPEPPSAA